MPAYSATQSSFLLTMRLRFAVVLLGSAMTLVPTLLRADASSPGPRWSHIKTALYFTSRDVDQLLTKPEDRRATLAYFAPLRLSKVYLEDARGEPAAVATYREIAAVWGCDATAIHKALAHSPVSADEIAEVLRARS